jgi:hypothetical protein
MCMYIALFDVHFHCSSVLFCNDKIYVLTFVGVSLHYLVFSSGGLSAAEYGRKKLNKSYSYSKKYKGIRNPYSNSIRPTTEQQSTKDLDWTSTLCSMYRY